MPRPGGARPHASTARTKQMGKQSYSPNQSMSDGRSCASEKAARVACSQLNMAVSMRGGGYSGPLASPPHASRASWSVEVACHDAIVLSADARASISRVSPPGSSAEKSSATRLSANVSP